MTFNGVIALTNPNLGVMSPNSVAFPPTFHSLDAFGVLPLMPSASRLVPLYKILNTPLQISSESFELYRIYYKKHLGLFFPGHSVLA